jgi:hypothetical protein
LTTPRKKTQIEIISGDCCGQCKYCHELPEAKREVGCYVLPPEYAYGETDIPDFLDFKPVKVSRPSCEKFKPKGIN